MTQLLVVHILQLLILVLVIDHTKCLLLEVWGSVLVHDLLLVKNSLPLPEFLLHYDTSLVLSEGVLRVDTGRALFDEIYVYKNEETCGETERGLLVVVDEGEKVWEGEFHCSFGESVFSILEYITAAPLDRPRVVDVFPYNGDFIALYRVQYLFDYVDEFIIVEAATTFSGKRKPVLLFTQKDIANQFEPYMSKITYVVVEEFPQYPNLDNIKGKNSDKGSSWLTFPDSYSSEHIENLEKMLNNPNFWRANYQRLFTKFFIRPSHTEGERQLILVTDCDELPNRTQFARMHDIVRGVESQIVDDQLVHPVNAPIPLFMMFFYYNFNTVNPYSWQQGYAISTEGYLGLHDMLTPRLPRRDSLPSEGQYIPEGGWHLSYFMSIDDIRRKVESIADQSYYNTNSYFKTDEHIRHCIANSKDLYLRQDYMSRAWLPRSKLRVKSFPEGWEQLHETLETMQS